MKIQELGHVVLYVTSLSRMADFYGTTLGFSEVSRGKDFAVFSGGRTHHELLLLEVGGTPEHKKHLKPGLYHIGFKVGNSTEELKVAHQELRSAGIPILGTGDHTVTHSLYILDPDGNELELYVDVNDVWKQNAQAIMAPVRPLVLE